MIDRPQAAAGLGLLATTAGVALVAVPGLASGLGLPAIVELGLVALVGLAALPLAAWTVRGSERSADGESTDRPALPHTEARPTYPGHTSEVRSRLEEVSWTDRHDSEPAARERFRRDLKERAVTVLARTEGRSEAEVAADLDRGTWTDDERAAAFFTGELVPPVSRLASLRAFLFGTDPPFRRRARHVIAALGERVTGSPVSRSWQSVPGNPESRRPATVGKYWANRDRRGEAAGLPESVRPLVAATLLVGGVGVVTGTPAVFLLTLFGLVAVAAAHLDRPAPVPLDVERSVSDAEPAPGETVTVTLRLHNTSGSTLPDCRVIDGVPPGLVVTDGTPRTAISLRPGTETTVRYTVEARQGVHEFEGPLLRYRGYVGVRRTERLVEDAPATLTCEPEQAASVSTTPRDQPTSRPARAGAAVAGAGVEFHGIREYRPGDPPARIDWNRRARGGDLATVEYLEPRLPKVLLLVDARRPAYVETDDGVPAVRTAAVVAEWLAEALLDDGVPVGLAALSPRDCWIAPAVGADHRRRLRDALASDPAFGWTPPDECDATAETDRIHLRAAPDAQVLVVSPLSDDAVASVARRLEVLGRRVTVWRPDPGCADGPLGVAEADAAVEWIRRVTDLRRAGTPVVDVPVAEVSSRVD